jgi:hypothetical protein
MIFTKLIIPNPASNKPDEKAANSLTVPSILA